MVTLAAILGVPVVVASFGYPGPYAPIVENYGFPFHRTLTNRFNIQPYFGYPFYNGIPNGLPLQVPAIATSRLIYSSSIYRGFSYQNKYGDGGRSEVVFVTGPDSQKLMQDSMEYLQSSLSSQYAIPVASNLTNTSSPTTTTESPQPSVAVTDGSPLLSDPAQPSIASIYRFQIYPNSLSPFFGAPFPLPTILAYHHTTQHRAPEAANTEKSGGEAEESMISEVGIAPPLEPTTRVESNSIETSTKDSTTEQTATATTVEVGVAPPLEPTTRVESNSIETSTKDSTTQQTATATTEEVSSTTTSTEATTFTTMASNESSTSDETTIKQEETTISGESQDTTTTSSIETTVSP